jgi:hypothetical protein
MSLGGPSYVSPLVNQRAARRRGFGADLSGLPRAEREQIYRRRRAAALGIAITAVLLVALIASSGGEETATADREALELPRGGREILPRARVVAFYGAPQDPELGVLGETPLPDAVAKLTRQARAYEQPGRPVLPAIELIATLAQAAPGDDGLYRLRQDDVTIRRHLSAARASRALLILDVQPGNADFMDEVRALEPYLVQPDVSLALDPEWKTPAGVAPGKQIGSTDAATVNEVSAYLAGLVRARGLPQKLLIVHQFTEEMVTGRDGIASRPEVAIVNNIDGFGTQPLKKGVYNQLANPAPPAPAPAKAEADEGELSAAPVTRTARRFNGFKLFYHEDTGLMAPGDVLGLRPAPDVVVYE